jgi:hypothetical protein
MAQTISLMVPTQSQIRSKAFAMSMNKEALTGTNLAYSTRSMALVWMLDAPETGADYMFSFEGGICRSGQTSASATNCRMHNRIQGASNDRLACRGGEFRDDLNAPSLERYFRGRNAPYSLNDADNLLKSQQMRPPSDHNPRLALSVGRAQQEGPAPCRCEPNIKERRVLVAATCEHNFGGGTGRMR